MLDELRAGLPESDVLVEDDGSTDGTAGVARAHGADVLSFSENRGLQEGIAAGYLAFSTRPPVRGRLLDRSARTALGDMSRCLTPDLTPGHVLCVARVTQRTPSTPSLRATARVFESRRRTSRQRPRAASASWPPGS